MMARIHNALSFLILVSFSVKTICIHDPITYKVKMYHHQSLVLFDDKVKEKSTFHLEVLDEEQMVHRFKHRRSAKPRTMKRNKRQNDFVSKTEGTSQYDEGSHQFHGDLESKEHEANNSYDYDYEKFKHEYYHEISTERARTTQEDYEEYEDDEVTTETTTQQATTTTISIEHDVPMENYCSVLLIFRTRVFPCLLYGIKNGNNDIKLRAGYVLLFWFVLYGIFASFLWCTRGWCCCCCPCLCCRPKDVVQDAKKYLSQNPPGKTQLGKQKSDVSYTPTSYEEACYKELETQVFYF